MGERLALLLRLNKKSPQPNTGCGELGLLLVLIIFFARIEKKNKSE